MGEDDHLKLKGRGIFNRLRVSNPSNSEAGLRKNGTENISLGWIVRKMFGSKTSMGMTEE